MGIDKRDLKDNMLINRRELLKVLAAGCMSGLLQACSSNTDPAKSNLSFSEIVLNQYTTDFGNVITQRPVVVSRPLSVSMLRKSFEYARKNRLQVTFRGGGQSFFGQSLCKDGMIIDMSSLNTESIPLRFGDDWVEAPAGMLLHDLLTLLRKDNVRLPIYTAATKATLGGTLSAGGLSGRSFSKGLLAHNVLETTIMGTDGRIWECSPDSNRDIFSCSVATMGSIGALLKARIRIEKLLPIRIQFSMEGNSINGIYELADRLQSVPEIVSMEGHLDISSAKVKTETFMTIEAEDENSIPEKKSYWYDIIRTLKLGADEIRAFGIDSNLGFSASIAGWKPTQQNIKTSLLNRPLSLFVMPISITIGRKHADGFIEELSKVAQRNRRYLMVKPYFAVIRSVKPELFEWLHSSKENDYRMGMDLFVSFPITQKERAMEILFGVAELAAMHKGLLYPYGFLPETDLLTQLLPDISNNLKQVVKKTDPSNMLRDLFPITHIPENF